MTTANTTSVSYCSCLLSLPTHIALWLLFQLKPDFMEKLRDKLKNQEEFEITGEDSVIRIIWAEGDQSVLPRLMIFLYYIIFRNLQPFHQFSVKLMLYQLTIAPH